MLLQPGHVLVGPNVVLNASEFAAAQQRARQQQAQYLASMPAPAPSAQMAAHAHAQQAHNAQMVS